MVPNCKHCNAADGPRRKYVQAATVAQEGNKNWVIAFFASLCVTISSVFVLYVATDGFQQARQSPPTTAPFLPLLGTLLGASLLVASGAKVIAYWDQLSRYNNGIRLYAYKGDGSDDQLQAEGWHVHFNGVGLNPMSTLTLVGPFNTGGSRIGTEALSWAIAEPLEVLSYGSAVGTPVLLENRVGERFYLSDSINLVQLMEHAGSPASLIVHLNKLTQIYTGAIPAHVMSALISNMQKSGRTRQSPIAAAWTMIVEELAAMVWTGSTAEDEARVAEICIRHMAASYKKHMAVVPTTA
ncbi:MAG: hypothetical protein A2848_00075 [Candidatus Magasanikbacteria bacterium RIFCSPHIGHO2_01_FULL_50_8]|uniref:Uncharacterized protein n=2 Tax=Candidatus Magasanikiibacteriota TaxID=1752731 RepID=A0A1F6LNI4_9BACT|nr:MAG: hypothetical protein A2848_00075 [Candidatus Magasanikbacteria bacterium RIFCSPHIGHO2_01_FULL_50_8]OGH67475.1 MAG: hypothetical protein A3C15_01830 [Candidatus Magasanikbacteria bacterium RIFCSPHIGHO2_02_FULL_50_9b]